jgi:hypothetical protein
VFGAGPLYGEVGMLVHECDVRVGLNATRLFDVVGHYGREDVLAPSGPPGSAAAEPPPPE